MCPDIRLRPFFKGMELVDIIKRRDTHITVRVLGILLVEVQAEVFRRHGLRRERVDQPVKQDVRDLGVGRNVGETGLDAVARNHSWPGKRTVCGNPGADAQEAADRAERPVRAQIFGPEPGECQRCSTPVEVERRLTIRTGCWHPVHHQSTRSLQL